MRYMNVMSVRRSSLLYLAIVLGVAACHRSKSAPPAGADKAIDVATVLAGCTGAAECEQKCAAGASGACLEAGRLHEFGHAGPRDAARARPFYERACALGNGGGCYNLAVLLETGNGVAKDAQRALALYEKVCAMGSKTACARAETLGEDPAAHGR